VRRAHVGGFGVDSRIILKLVLKEWDVMLLTRSVWMWMLVSGRLCNRVRFTFNSECLEQPWDTLKQCCAALNCVLMRQAV
jgi:hypothetical protein